jgi:hypothetical protein
MATAVLGALGCLVLLFLGDREERSWAAGLLSAYLVQGWVGYRLVPDRSQWNAWALMTCYGLNLVISIVRDGSYSGLLLRVLIGVIYVRGFMATIEHAEVTRAIASHTEASPPSPGTA